MHRRSDELGGADRTIAVIAFIISSVVLVFGLLLHTFQVTAQLRLEGIKASISTIVTS